MIFNDRLILLVFFVRVWLLLLFIFIPVEKCRRMIITRNNLQKSIAISFDSRVFGERRGIFQLFSLQDEILIDNGCMYVSVCLSVWVCLNEWVFMWDYAFVYTCLECDCVSHSLLWFTYFQWTTYTNKRTKLDKFELKSSESKAKPSRDRRMRLQSWFMLLIESNEKTCAVDVCYIFGLDWLSERN